MDRITAIRRSLAVFAYGIIACVPFIGLIPAIVALVIGERVRRKYRDWNPAGFYLRCGQSLAVLGILISGLIAFAIVFASYSHYNDPGYHWDGD